MGQTDDTMGSTVYDNGGRSFDRYTVRINDDWFAIGPTGNAPNGVCLRIDGVVEGPHLGARISVDEMTDAARAAVESITAEYEALP